MSYDPPAPAASPSAPDGEPVPRRSLLAAGLALWPLAFASARPVAAVPRADAPAPEEDAAPVEPPPSGPPAAPSRPIIDGLGVNLAGAEFGAERRDFSNENPGDHGRDFLHPSAGAVRDVAAAGARLVRFPVRWERLQPAPGGPLAADELGRLRLTLDRLHAAGLAVVIDLHNYARYALATGGGVRRVLIDEIVAGPDGRRGVPVSRHHFAEFWATLAGSFAGHPAVAGWGLMNEPHDLAPYGRAFDGGRGCDWPAIGRLAADAVRNADPGAAVVVAGADWSSSDRWLAANGPDPWVDGPGVIYEAHCYLDADAAGKYRASFAAEAAADPRVADRAVRRMEPFLEWCARTGSRGFLGEFGVPPADAGWLSPLWAQVAALNASGTPGCLWAAGEWWGDYPLNAHPAGGVAGPVLETVLNG